MESYARDDNAGVRVKRGEFAPSGNAECRIVMSEQWGKGGGEGAEFKRSKSRESAAKAAKDVAARGTRSFDARVVKKQNERA